MESKTKSKTKKTPELIDNRKQIRGCLRWGVGVGVGELGEGGQKVQTGKL